ERRMSRTIRLFVVIMLFGVAAQIVLSQARHAVQGAAGHRNTFRSERLVSIEPLPPLEEGPMCPPDSEPESLMASVSTPPSLLAVMRQQSQSASDSTKAAVAARKPIATLKDPRN